MCGKAFLLSLLLITGCSYLGEDPARVRSEVETFAKGVENAAAAYREEQKRFVEYYAVVARAAALANLSPLRQDGPCLRQSGRFVLQAKKLDLSHNGYGEAARALVNACAIQRQLPSQPDGGDGDWVDFTSTTGEILPKHDRLIRALEKYASALATLANSAQDRKAFDAAAGDAKESILGFLRAAVAETGGQFNFGEEASVIGDAINGVIGSALEARRRAALADVVLRSHGALTAAARHLGSATRAYHAAALPSLRDRLSDAVMRTTSAATNKDRPGYEKGLEETIEARQLFIAYLNADPGFVFEQMIRAHEALGKKLKDPDVSLSVLAGQVEYFLETSKGFLEALQSIQRKAEGEAKQ